MSKPSSVAAALFLLFGSLSASAQTLPYDFEVDSFAVPERGVFDGFDDGTIDPGWTSSNGTVSESGSTLRLSSPGESGFLPAGVQDEASVLSGQGLLLDGAGSFTASSVWLPSVPGPSQGLNFSIGSVDSFTGDVHQLTIGIGNVSSAVSDVLGGLPGLSVSVLDVVRGGAPDGPILSLDRTSVAIQASDVTGPIVLSLAFDDALDTMTPIYSLDGGTTTVSAFGASAWSFVGGGFSLSASSTVPEPGTALLLGLGLALLGRRCGRA